MEVKICNKCGEHNVIVAWKCRKCGEPLSDDVIADVDETGKPLPGRSSSTPQTTASPTEKWSCSNCGGINPKGRNRCLACDHPYIAPEEIESRRRDVIQQKTQQLRQQIQLRADGGSSTRWEYCFLLSGIGSSSGNDALDGVIVFLSDGTSLDLPLDATGVALAELGQQGWELSGTLALSDVQHQYPVKNLRPLWSYMLAAALKAERPEAVYEYETVREMKGMLMILKRPIIGAK